MCYGYVLLHNEPTQNTNHFIAHEFVDQEFGQGSVGLLRVVSDGCLARIGGSKMPFRTCLKTSVLADGWGILVLQVAFLFTWPLTIQ